MKREKSTISQGVARTLISWSVAHPWTVIGITLFLWGVAGIMVSRLRIETELLALIPNQNPTVKTFKETMQRFGTADFLLLGIRIEDPDQLEPSLVFADILVEKLRENDVVDWVEYRVQDFADSATHLFRYATLFMTEDDLDVLLSNLDPGALEARVNRLSDSLRSPTEFGLEQVRSLDILGVLPMVSDNFQLQDLGPHFDRESGYFLDSQRQFALIVVKPVKPAVDIPFCRTLMDSIQEDLAESTAEWKEEGYEGSVPQVLPAGGYVIALDDSRMISKDMLLGAVTALIGVSLLFTLAFRFGSALGVAILPLLTGLLLTGAFAALALGRLNTVTTAFGAFLIGLGIDFAIILFARYLEERHRKRVVKQAFEHVARHTAPGVILGAVTTSATFLAFLVSDFKGLSELGILTGVGILLVALCMFTLMPALVALCKPTRTNPSTIQVMGLEKILRGSVQHPLITLGLALLVTLLAVPMALKVRYDDDILNMRSAKNRGVQNQKVLMDAFGMRFTPMMIRVDGDTEAQAVSRAQALIRNLQPLVDGKNLARLTSPAAFLPAASNQQRILERLSALNLDPQALRDSLIHALSQAGLRASAFEPGIQALQHMLRLTVPLSVNDLKGTSAGHLLSRFVQVRDDGASVLIHAYPPPGRWRTQAPRDVEAVVHAMPHATLTGAMIISSELKRVVWRDATIAAMIGTLIVWFLMGWQMRSMSQSLLALTPLGMGLCWTAGLMGALDVDVNFMNIFVFTMLIGIGVDYGIHLTHRWKEVGVDAIRLGQTGKAIILAALTTMTGFGSLVLSHYPGLRSMGIVALMGAFSTACVSLTVLPAILTLYDLRRTPQDTGKRTDEPQNVDPQKQGAAQK